MNAKSQTHEFKAEVQQVLSLMVNSLYSNREIFLRELISNASDACDKLRFRALSDDALLEGDNELRIEIEADPEAGTLTVRDNGIGMSREEVAENIGTIAHSGTRRFLEQAAAEGGLDHKLIGQFGVGFYSAFMVAERVRLHTRRAGDEPAAGVAWESDGTGEYTIGPLERERHGTEVILHLKKDEAGFLEPGTIRSLVARYSDHIGFPIRLRDESADGDWQTINQAAALWTLPKSEIADEDYQSFYQHLTHDFEEALAWAHNNVEGSQNYTSLLYVPSHAPFDFMLQRDERRGLRLYVRRVFIMDAAEQLLPHYLRFVRGVVDSDDLPLNISREMLQDNERVRKIRAAVVRRSLDLLERLAADEPEKYHRFWDNFGTVLKEGIVEDTGNREKIAALLRFASSGDREAGQRTSLGEYRERMQEGQDAIWYITAETLSAAANSPHLERLREQGIEVLLMTDRIDEWIMGYLPEFDGVPLRSAAKADIPSPEGDRDEAPGRDELLQRMKRVLGDEVEDVRASRRLKDSLSCLVLGEQDLALHLRRMLEQAGQKLPEARPVLEVNLAHPLIGRLAEVEDDSDFEDWTRVIFEQAVLAEGGQLEDPASFVHRLNRLVLSVQPSGG